MLFCQTICGSVLLCSKTLLFPFPFYFILGIFPTPVLSKTFWMTILQVKDLSSLYPMSSPHPRNNSRTGSNLLPIFFFSFLAAPRPMEFISQGSDLSHSHKLFYSWGNTGSLTHSAGAGIEPVSQCSRGTPDPDGPQQHSEFISLIVTFKTSAAVAII